MDGILEARHLSRNFGMVMAVNNISVTFAEGEVVGIVGTNGSGKTTFLNLITGYVRPSAGEIRFQGRDITGRPPKEVTAMGIARSFQIPQLYTGLTVLENLLLAVAGRAGRPWDCWRPLKRNGWLDEAIDVLDRFGFEHAEEKMVSSLPEGGRKLLDVAVSFMLRPRLLLMDEPTSGVSVKDKFSVMDTVLRVLKETGVTTVFVEHDMEIVERYAERAIAFDDGRIIADGTVAEILAEPAVREAVMGVAPDA